jgi:hypothetical protein
MKSPGTSELVAYPRETADESGDGGSSFIHDVGVCPASSVVSTDNSSVLTLSSSASEEVDVKDESDPRPVDGLEGEVRILEERDDVRELNTEEALVGTALFDCSEDGFVGYGGSTEVERLPIINIRPRPCTPSRITPTTSPTPSDLVGPEDSAFELGNGLTGSSGEDGNDVDA